jgi:hypothetical protein
MPADETVDVAAMEAARLLVERRETFSKGPLAMRMSMRG